jgi:hypothetical protein
VAFTGCARQPAEAVWALDNAATPGPAALARLYAGSGADTAALVSFLCLSPLSPRSLPLSLSPSLPLSLSPLPSLSPLSPLSHQCRG